jgi:putative ABC transport system ATP-binding protein
MTVLLRLDSVTRRIARGERGRDHVALRDVSLSIRPGELVGVWGPRRSGRTTLTMVAAGMRQPTEGTVHFDGVDLSRAGMLGMRGGIGFCDREFDPVIAETVIEHVTAPLLSEDVKYTEAEYAAYRQLERVGAAELAHLKPAELDAAGTLRVAVARATVTRPRLLVVDEPTTGVRASEERPLLRLLHSFARDEGVAVLLTADDAAALAGVDRALSLNSGVLRGVVDDASGEEPVPADRVVPLRSHETR